MAFVTYRASDSIIPIHLAGILYTFDFRLQDANRATEILKREPRSLSGAKETLYYGKIVRWKCVMEPIAGAECGLIEEFLDSTADGQVFSFDPYGTFASQKLPMTCDRDDAGYDKRRFIRTGDYLADLYEFSFEINQRT